LIHNVKKDLSLKMASKHHLTEIENQVEKMRETLEDSIQGLSK